MSRQTIVSPQGLPCVPPPWGELVAVDLSTATIRWRVPLGGAVKRDGKIIPVAGTPNLGGPIITAGGLVFIGSAMDDGAGALDCAAASRRSVNTNDVPGEWKAICGDCGRGPRETGYDSRRFARCVCSAIEPCGNCVSHDPVWKTHDLTELTTRFCGSCRTMLGFLTRRSLRRSG